MLNRFTGLGYICGVGHLSHTPVGVPRLRVSLSINGRRGDRTEEGVYDVLITKETADRLADIDLDGGHMPDLTEFETARIPRNERLVQVTPAELRAIADRMEAVAGTRPAGAPLCVTCPIDDGIRLMWSSSPSPGPFREEGDPHLHAGDAPSATQNALASAIARVCGPPKLVAAEGMRSTTPIERELNAEEFREAKVSGRLPGSPESVS